LFACDTSSANKNFPMMMKSIKHILKFSQVGGCNEVTMCNVTEV